MAAPGKRAVLGWMAAVSAATVAGMFGWLVQMVDALADDLGSWSTGSRPLLPDEQALVRYALPVELAWVAAAAVILSLLVGLPAHRWLHRRGRTGLSTYVVTITALAAPYALLLTAVLSVFICAWGCTVELWSAIAWPIPFAVLLSAMVSGAAFWLVRRPDRA